MKTAQSDRCSGEPETSPPAVLSPQRESEDWGWAGQGRAQEGSALRLPSREDGYRPCPQASRPFWCPALLLLVRHLGLWAKQQAHPWTSTPCLHRPQDPQADGVSTQPWVAASPPDCPEDRCSARPFPLLSEDRCLSEGSLTAAFPAALNLCWFHLCLLG